MTSAQALSALSSHIASELREPLPEAVQAFAAEIAAHGGVHVAAVLFYGSNLRSGALDGVLDFYVLVDSLRGWHRRRLPAAANRILPPNILLFERKHAGQTLRAKVAVLRVDQFHKAMHRRSLDTTMWARYAQPAALAWVRDEASRVATVQSITRAVVSAADWAAHPAASRLISGTPCSAALTRPNCASKKPAVRARSLPSPARATPPCCRWHGARPAYMPAAKRTAACARC
jgi:hypothetical protein